MAATATKPKAPSAKLTMEFRNGEQIYRLPKRERDKLQAAHDLCGELTKVADMNPEATEANAKLAELLARFPTE